LKSNVITSTESNMAAGVQRVLSKCQKCVESGNFYEAHQMYRTLYFRYVS